MKKRLSALLIACVCMFGFAFAPNTFAYVSAPSDAGATGGVYAGAVTEAATAEELAKKGQDAYFNAAGLVSEAGRRVSLRLTADVTLSADVTLGADCNLDLGGFDLDLGGFVLTVRHSYAGAFVLTNGTVTANGGKIILETPRAHWRCDATQKGGTQPVAFDPASVTADSADRDAKVAAAARNFVAKTIAEGGCRGAYRGDVPLPARFGSLGRFSYTVPAVAADVMKPDGAVMLASDDAATDLSFELSVTFTPSAGEAVAFTVPMRLAGAANAAAWSDILNGILVGKLNAVPAAGQSYDYDATLSQPLYLPVDGYWRGEIGYTTGTPEYVAITDGADAKLAYLDAAAIKAASASPDLTVTVQGIATVYRLEIVSSGAQTDIPAKILRIFFDTDDASVLTFAKDSATGTYTSYPLAYPTADAEKNAKLADLGLNAVVKTTLYYNSQNTFTKTGDLLTINPAAADDSASAQLEITLNIGGEEAMRLVDLRYTTSATDTQANPARFRTHFSYFEQQFRNGTHTKYEMDASVTLSATKNGAYPYVAYRVTDASGATYGKASADGGIDVAFRGSDGNVYTPVYVVQNGNPIFDGFAECAAVTDGTGAVTKSRLAVSMEKFVKTDGATEDPVWTFAVDPEKRNVRNGVADETLYLEYQYTFASDFGGNEQSWFVYTDVTDTDRKETSEFVLLALVMQGGDAAQYDFGITADDTRIYEAVRNEFAPKFTYIPRKYLGESREELNVKALLYPDTDETDGIPNGDVAGGAELDSVAGRTFTNWNWLHYLTGVKTLNLHGMHITDALVESHLSLLTHLTGLDVSGVYNANADYNERNYNRNDNLAASYDSYSSAISDTGLDTIAQKLTALENLNIAFCRIQEFSGLAYLGENIATCHLEGNMTGAGSSTRAASLGSYGGYSAIFIAGLAARCDVYQTVGSETLAVTNESIQQVWARCYGFVTQKEWSAGDDFTKDILPTLPTDIMDGVNSLRIPTYVDGNLSSFDWYSPENSRMTYEVKEEIGEIWLKINLRSWNLTSKTPVIFIRRLAFTFA